MLHPTRAGQRCSRFPSNLWRARSVGPRRFAPLAIASFLVAAACLPFARAADPAEVQKALLAGNYTQVIKQAQGELRDSPGNSEWSTILVQALLTVGRYPEADKAMKEALQRDTRNIRLRWLARDVAFANGRPEQASDLVDDILRAYNDSRWLYRTPADLVVLGQAALARGVDPKEILDKLFGAAQNADPKLRDAYLARGNLALDKHDFALAAKAFEEGLKQLPEDPDLLCGKAKAYAGGQREIAVQALNAALKVNPRHIPSLLLMANHRIDGEAYDEANELLDEVIAVNPVHPEAWAYRAIIAHLKNDPAGEKAARDRALSSWRKNPRVDFLIGEKLSAKYRFAEGAAYQRRAREFDPNYQPALSQLASDLLRLGDEAEGWDLAQAVHKRDEYDVEAYNLVTLKDTMAKYAALTSDDFVIRMTAPEIAVYGSRVLSLLRRAQESLVAKYGVELARPTYVEIFADQRDFAVRTFGLPDVPGFLGVCFGRVVTANSPATSASPTNWESVLWHEFCHVITLQLTKNKMPRWLSEGISVYEERQANPTWGMKIDPKYRQMLLGEDLVPVGKLSAAFLTPKSSQHLQFAYLESSLVVEYIVNQFGLEKLRGILTDLRDGLEINAALAKNTVPLEELEKGFEKYAHERAEQLAPKLDWDKPDAELLLPDAADDFAAWQKKHPDNYWGLRLHAQRLIEQQKWQEAKVPLERLIELYPQQDGPDSVYRVLVSAYRALNDTAGERAVLDKWVAVDDEAADAYLRLAELAAAEKDWPTVRKNCDRYLAVNPLVAPPYRYLAQAAEETGDESTAVVGWRTLIQLDVPERTDAHFKLAQVLHKRNEDADARRHTLLALEETPRYRDALRLLLDLDRARQNPAPEAPAAAVVPPPITAPANPPTSIAPTDVSRKAATEK